MNRDTIEANVRLICSVRGISQTGLAGMMGVTRQRVIQIMDHPTERGVAAIAAALGVPVEWLEDPALAGKTVEELRRGTMNQVCDISVEALEYAKCYLAWYRGEVKFPRGADIYRSDDGRYHTISSGCGNDLYHIVDRNITSDQFGSESLNSTTPEEMAEMLIESGYMAEMLGVPPMRN